MVSITSDSPQIKSTFSKLIETLESVGAGFHSGLCIDASAGGICVTTKEPMAKGREIIRIPRAGLMPGDQYVVKLVGDNLAIDYFVNSTLRDSQKAIVSQMFEIYNLTGKIPEHKQLNFLLSLQDYPSLYEKFMRGRDYNPKYDGWFKGLQEGMSTGEYNRFLIDTFIQTRPLGYSDPVREDSTSTIMPIIDFLNHHWEGANFSVGGGSRVGDLTIATSQPFESSTECFAFYGVLDSADALLRYNFVDQSAHIVRSISLELDLPDGRKILVKNEGNKPRGPALPNALSDLLCYASHFTFEETEGKLPEEQNLKVPFLIITPPESKAPQALRRILTYILSHMYAKFNRDIDFDAAEWIGEAENKIIIINKEHYEDVKQHTEELIKEKGPSDGLDRMKLLAEVQLAKLEEYIEFSKTQRVLSPEQMEQAAAARN